MNNMGEENKAQLFYASTDSNLWRPLGEVTETPTLDEECEALRDWKGIGTFTATATVGEKDAGKLRQLLRGKKPRLPRKMKKASKQLIVYECAGHYLVYRKDCGHFNTKWLRKAAFHLVKQYMRR